MDFIRSFSHLMILLKWQRWAECSFHRFDTVCTAGYISWIVKDPKPKSDHPKRFWSLRNSIFDSNIQYPKLEDFVIESCIIQVKICSLCDVRTVHWTESILDAKNEKSYAQNRITIENGVCLVWLRWMSSLGCGLNGESFIEKDDRSVRMAEQNPIKPKTD